MATISPGLASVVLVHGAFVDGSGWQAVHDLLVSDGHEVLVVQNPTITLEGDADATRRAIAAASNPVILVGHSYGGAVITAAGNGEKVRSLVYVAAYAPDAGESVETLVSRPLPPGTPAAPVLPPEDGFLTLDKDRFPSAFAADVDPARTRFMANAQVPWGLGAFSGKIAEPAWKTKPVFHLLTSDDLMVPPALQREMAQRASATITEVAASHAVMISQPEAVVQCIRNAMAV